MVSNGKSVSFQKWVFQNHIQFWRVFLQLGINWVKRATEFSRQMCRVEKNLKNPTRNWTPLTETLDSWHPVIHTSLRFPYWKKNFFDLTSWYGFVIPPLKKTTGFIDVRWLPWDFSNIRNLTSGRYIYKFVHINKMCISHFLTIFPALSHVFTTFLAVLVLPRHHKLQDNHQSCEADTIPAKKVGKRVVPFGTPWESTQ